MKLYKGEIKEILIAGMFSLIGVGITVASFMLYNKFSYSTVTIFLICLLDVAYAYFHFKKSDLEDVFDKIRFLKCAVIYWLILFVVISIFYCFIFKKEFSASLLLYPIFIMPSFMIVVLIFGLIIVLLSYS